MADFPAVLTWVQHDGLDDLRAHSMHRAECRHRFLWDQCDLGATQGTHLAAARRQAHEVDLLSSLAIQDLAAGDAARRVDQLQDCAHRYALSAAALTHDSDDLAREHIEVHAIDGAHDALVERDRDAQVTYPQQRISGCRDRMHRAGHRPPG